MAASRTASTRPFLALVWLALAAGCGRSVLYGDFARESGDLDGDGGEGEGNSGGTSAGRGGRSGTTGSGATGPNTGGTTTGSGGDGSGATGPNTGGANSTGGSPVVTGGTSNGGEPNGGTSSGNTSTGGSAIAGANSGGVGASSGQGGSPQAGKGGQAGEPSVPDVPCGDTICDISETCCVGLTATACLPEGSACNGAILNCSSPGYCAAEGGGEFCCLTMGGGMATADCSDDCSNSFDGSGRLRLRLCESNDDCTPNRECRMTFVGVNACMRRL
jgi:hypothetical protein